MDWGSDRDEGDAMTDRTTAPLITGELLAQAVGTGLLGAALTVEQHPRLLRGLGLALAGAAGVGSALAAGGVLPSSSGSSGDAPKGDSSPAVAVAVGAGIFALTAGASEVGLRAQGRFERWADDTFGHPRLAVGVATGALALAVDGAARIGERRSA